LLAFENFVYWAQTSSLGILFTVLLIALCSVLIKLALGITLEHAITFFIPGNAKMQRALRRLAVPVSFIPITLCIYLVISYIHVPSKVVFYTHAFWKSAFTFNLVWIIYTSSFPIQEHMQSKKEDFDDIMVVWFMRIARMLAIVMGVFALLGNWNISFTALATSIGIVGIPLAFAAQDMLKNIVSGMSILSEHRFTVGDIIRINSGSNVPGFNIWEGEVEHIGLRSTQIRRFDKMAVFIPNSILADSAVVNVSSRLYRILDWKLQFELRTTSDQLRYVRREVEKYIIDSGDFVNPPEAIRHIRLNKFNDQSVELMIYCFANTNVWTDYLKIKENLLLAVKTIIEKANASLAMPSRQLYIEKEDKHLRRPYLPRELTRAMCEADAAEHGNKSDEKSGGVQ